MPNGEDKNHKPNIVITYIASKVLETIPRYDGDAFPESDTL